MCQQQCFWYVFISPTHPQPIPPTEQLQLRNVDSLCCMNYLLQVLPAFRFKIMTLTQSFILTTANEAFSFLDITLWLLVTSQTISHFVLGLDLCWLTTPRLGNDGV